MAVRVMQMVLVGLLSTTTYLVVCTICEPQRSPDRVHDTIDVCLLCWVDARGTQPNSNDRVRNC